MEKAVAWARAAGFARLNVDVIYGAAGETTDRIATEMGVTRSTARTHVQNVLTKLGVHSRLEAVVVAAKSGIRLPAV